MYVVDYEGLTPTRPPRRRKWLISRLLGHIDINAKKCGAHHTARPAPTTTPLTIILPQASGRGSEYNPDKPHDALCDLHDRSGDCRSQSLAASAWSEQVWSP